MDEALACQFHQPDEHWPGRNHYHLEHPRVRSINLIGNPLCLPTDPSTALISAIRLSVATAHTTWSSAEAPITEAAPMDVPIKTNFSQTGYNVPVENPWLLTSRVSTDR